MIELRIDVFHHFSGVAEATEALQLLRDIKAQGEQIMASQQDALAALGKIDTATTNQGMRLGQLGDSLQETHNDITDLIAQLGTTVPQEVLDGLNAIADKTQVISNSLDQHAEFSKEIAGKWQTNPVPVPVPPQV